MLRIETHKQLSPSEEMGQERYWRDAPLPRPQKLRMFTGPQSTVGPTMNTSRPSSTVAERNYRPR